MRKIFVFILAAIAGQITYSQNWVDYSSGSKIPENSVVAGKSSTGENIYIARANYNSGVHPGKIHNEYIYIGWGGKELSFENGQVLSVNNKKKISWEKWNGYAPKKAYKGGAENNQDLYVCRAEYNGDMIPGKIVGGNCNISWGGKEIVIKENFEVLVIRNGGKQNDNGGKTNDNGGKTNDKVDDNAVIGLEISNKAPELKYLSPTGESISLSSLKGKYVLIDFWASWCGPCRRENPNVVSNYHKYKNSSFKNGNGFTVYGVSLDNNKSSWTNAIKNDNLAWPNHVSDLKGWGCEGAGIYKVNSIPSNFLIDGNGIIVGKNLRGSSLGYTLQKFLK